MAFRNLTNSGKEYLATRLANELPVKFIKAKIGNGSVPLLVNPADTKDLYNFKKEVTIIEAVQEQNSIKLTLQVTNNEILEGFYLKEIGIYVDDNGKEVLYWYCNEDNSQYINAQTDVPLSFEIDIMMEVTNINSTVIEWAGKENWISKNYFDEKVRTFEIPTIAELQSRKNLKIGDIVELLGYYEAGDGAGHKRIIANEDDGSGVQLNNKLWANIVHNGEVNVSWFGAKGDGINDDTDTTQKTLDFCSLFKGITIIDKKIKIKGINIPHYVTLTATSQFEAEYFTFGFASVLKDIEFIASDNINKNPLFLIDRDNLGINIENDIITANRQKCDIVIKNIKIFGNKYNDKQERDLLVVRNIEKNKSPKQGAGLWGLLFSNITGDIEFNTIIKLQCAKLSTQENDCRNWITYCTFENIRWYHYVKAIELLTYNQDLSDGEYGYDTHNSRLSLIQEIYFNNCTFESSNQSETFARFGNGCTNIFINNSYAGDFDVNKFKTYYIFDNRGRFRLSSMKLLFLRAKELDERVYTSLGELEYDLRQYNEINIKDLGGISSNCYGNEIIANYYQHSYFIVISKIPPIDKVTDASSISFILSQTANSDLLVKNVPMIHLELFAKGGSVGVSKIKCITNILQLKTLSIYTDEKGHRYLGVKVSQDNYFGFIKGWIKPFSYEKFYFFKKYTDTQTPEKNGLTFVEDIAFIQENKASQLNAIYILEKMKQENVYDDYITYMDEKTAYDKKQEKLGQERQLAYQEALKENPNLSYEDFMALQPMTLNLVEEPQPSKALQEFMKKYL